MIFDNLGELNQVNSHYRLPKEFVSDGKVKNVFTNASKIKPKNRWKLEITRSNADISGSSVYETNSNDITNLKSEDAESFALFLAKIANEHNTNTQSSLVANATTGESKEQLCTNGQCEFFTTQSSCNG